MTKTKAKTIVMATATVKTPLRKKQKLGSDMNANCINRRGLMGKAGEILEPTMTRKS